MWPHVVGVTIVIAIIIGMEWGMLKHQKRERRAFLWILAVGWLLAITLIIQPDLPGPTQFVDALYRPLGNMLKPPQL
jgi:hypothetical protein